MERLFRRRALLGVLDRPADLTACFGWGKEVMLSERRRWTPEEEEQLRREVCLGRSTADIADKIGRTISAVVARAYLLQLPLGPRFRHRLSAALRRRVRWSDLGLKQRRSTRQTRGAR